MANPGNQHCANCVGTLSFSMLYLSRTMTFKCSTVATRPNRFYPATVSWCVVGLCPSASYTSDFYQKTRDSKSILGIVCHRPMPNLTRTCHASFSSSPTCMTNKRRRRLFYCRISHQRIKDTILWQY